MGAGDKRWRIVHAKLMSSDLRFPHFGSAPQRDNPLTIQHLQNLQPFLDRMTVEELLFLAWSSSEKANDAQGAIANWLRKYVVPRLSLNERGRVRGAERILTSRS